MLRAVRPSFAFPTHDAVLSPEGKAIVDRVVTGVATDLALAYERIDEKTIEL